MQNYWIGVVSKNHVKKGVEGGFAQLCHGNKSALKKMKKGDILIYYSPKVDMSSKKKCQCFTAIGRVKNDEPYQVKMTATFHPYRLKVEYFPSKDIDIYSMLDKLKFTKENKNWGYKLRFGIFQICEHDYHLIKKAMDPSVSTL